MTPDSILANLNPPQRDAVQHGTGPLLIQAGAGSAKSPVITRRIAYLIPEHPVPPQQIAAVTFTNKAATEMRKRVEDLLGDTAAGVTLGTFHALCARMLRQWPTAAHLRPQFVIYDQADQLGAIKEAIRSLNTATITLNPYAMAQRISEAKNELLTPEQLPLEPDEFSPSIFRRAYTRYQELLNTANAVDFDDLLLRTVLLFREHPDILQSYHRRWSHLLVDEYQDTNGAQYEIVRLLTEASGNLCVVGDDDQAIYRWRGANIQNILGYEHDHPGCRVITLEQNYRSTQTILAAAGALVNCNTHRKTKTLWTANPIGAPILLHFAPTERAEAAFVTSQIRALQATRGSSLNDFAVLYRVNAQSRSLEEQFRLAEIPYDIVGGVRFYERKEIKNALAYLRLIVNPHDDQSFRRILNVPARGIGKGSLAKLDVLAATHRTSLWTACQTLSVQSTLGTKARAGLIRFLALMTSLCDHATLLDVPELLLELLDRTDYLAELSAQHTDEATARLDNLRELIVASQGFPGHCEDHTIVEFLDHVALISDIDTIPETTGRVTLMTLHATKGLEFPTVFMTGLEDGILPHARALEEPGGLEEERRLCYVGMTRAMQRLYLSLAQVRRLYQDSHPTEPSRFLSEIPQDTLQMFPA